MLFMENEGGEEPIMNDCISTFDERDFMREDVCATEARPRRTSRIFQQAP
jgi:hypothetical protein